MLKDAAILVTRPEHQADNFCQLVESAQGQAIRFPVIAIQEIPLDEQAIASLQSEPDALIFISANAVRLGVPALQQAASGLLKQSRVIAIGQATATQLEQAGHPPVLVPPSPYNSEALMALPEMQDVAGRHFAVIKGKGGRTYLMEQLRQRGAVVSEIDIYVRIKSGISNAPLDDLMKSSRAIVSVTSIKGLHYLFEIASETQAAWLKAEAQFLVPGNRVAEEVKDVHIQSAPWVAENATDAEMFDVLCRSLSIM